MKKLYDKSELTFALILIGIYTIGQSFATSLNQRIGVDYSANMILCVALAVFLLVFILKNGLAAKNGLCRSAVPARKFLWFIPLIALSSINFWNGTAVNFTSADLVCYIIFMFCVGIVEELLFRGLLFNAIAKDSVRLVFSVK